MASSSSTTSTTTENWYLAAPETTTDSNGFISELNMNWHQFWELSQDDSIYEEFVGSIVDDDASIEAAFGDLTRVTEINDGSLDRNVYLGSSDQDGAIPLKIQIYEDVDMGSDLTGEGFSVAFTVGYNSAARFENENIVSTGKRDYDIYFGAQHDGTTPGIFEARYDRRPSTEYDFSGSFNSLVNTYVGEIYAITGTPSESNVTYNKAPKSAPSAKKASTFDTEARVKTSPNTPTATTATTVSSGGY